MSRAEKRIVGCFLMILGILGFLISAAVIVTDVLPLGHTGAQMYDYMKPLSHHEFLMIAVTHVFIITAAAGFIIFDNNRP